MKRLLLLTLIVLGTAPASAQTTLYSGYATTVRTRLTQIFAWPSQAVCEDFRAYERGRPKGLSLSPCRAATFYERQVPNGTLFYLNVHTSRDGLTHALGVRESLSECQRVTVPVAPPGTKQSGCRRVWLVWS